MNKTQASIEIREAKTQDELSAIIGRYVTFDDQSNSEPYNETAGRFRSMGRINEANLLDEANIRWWQIEEPGKYDNDGNIIPEEK